MTANELDRQIRFEREVTTGAVDGLDEAVKTWTTITTVWAKRSDVSDMENVRAGKIGSAIRTRFKIRSTEKSRSITPVDRIIHENRIWNIHGIKETQDGRRRFLEVTAVTNTD